jgi:hypothetical protein
MKALAIPDPIGVSNVFSRPNHACTRRLISGGTNTIGLGAVLGAGSRGECENWDTHTI